MILSTGMAIRFAKTEGEIYNALGFPTVISGKGSVVAEGIRNKE